MKALDGETKGLRGVGDRMWSFAGALISASRECNQRARNRREIGHEKPEMHYRKHLASTSLRTGDNENDYFSTTAN